jgi:hypothetical protein
VFAKSDLEFKFFFKNEYRILTHLGRSWKMDTKLNLSWAQSAWIGSSFPRVLTNPTPNSLSFLRRIPQLKTMTLLDWFNLFVASNTFQQWHQTSPVLWGPLSMPSNCRVIHVGGPIVWSIYFQTLRLQCPPPDTDRRDSLLSRVCHDKFNLGLLLVHQGFLHFPIGTTSSTGTWKNQFNGCHGIGGLLLVLWGL